MLWEEDTDERDLTVRELNIWSRFCVLKLPRSASHRKGQIHKRRDDSGVLVATDKATETDEIEIRISKYTQLWNQSLSGS